jgi:signal transduction histidine kinase
MLRNTYRELTTFSLIMLLMLWGFYLLDSVHSNWVEGRVRIHVAEQLVQRGVILSNTLNSKLSLLYGLRSFVEVDPTPERIAKEFPYIAASLRGSSGGVRALQLVKDGIIRFTYPENREEGLVGYNLMKDPRPSVPRTIRTAMESEKITLNGPLELKQGGSGVVARLPIHCSGDTWGLAAVVIDLEELFIEAGVTSRHGELLVSARDTDRKTFFGDPDVFASAPVIQRLPLVDGHWEVAAVPAAGWAEAVSSQVLSFRISGAIILILLLSLFMVSARNKYVLSKLVERRTQELQNLNADLNNEIDARRRTEHDLVTALDKAEHSDRLKDAFITSMSHEIRTPLHVILGYVDLLRAPDEEIGHEKEMFIDSMKNAGGRLMRTVEDLLHISSLRTGTFKIKKQDIELVATTKSLMSNFHELAADRGLRLVFRSTLVRAQLHADSYCLEQVINNLLDNAIKYTEQGTVELSIDGTENSCIVSVKDSGIGISSDYICHAFDVFSQESVGYNRPYDGLGLGLALTKQYVELNDGEIAVNSEKGRGSEFRVTLPAQAVVAHSIPEEISTDSRQLVEAPSLTFIRNVASVA